ncbi:prepilin-type N-terminal cleavage/methylation domain-containing protein [Paraferrimonas sedimenticola]|uniref:Prepilin-type N-terminal cleavage/methylation domain-containing protein n=1 Tax=Paraferrimonas sedimenticola TaxID=375674 RepID=A0AA37VUE6_9GAMM|nr:hypothetical protein GCM10007895_11500 [Paraferrimonas sedimenticola]
MTSKQAQGFTLIEVVVVVIVLGVLAITATSKYIDLKKDAQIAVFTDLAGQLNQALLNIETIRHLPNKIHTPDAAKPAWEKLAYNDSTELWLYKGFMHARELCHVLGLTASASNKNGKIDSNDGKFTCKDENTEFGWIRMNNVDPNECYIRYVTNKYQSQPRAILQGECAQN